jgi:hypothetical protein
MHTTTRYAFFGQLALMVFLFICALLKPKFLFEANEGGISNYGLYAETVIPYTLAFFAAGSGTILAALSLRNRPIRITLIVLGILFFAVLLSTYRYKTDQTLKDAHEILSSTLLLSEVAIGTWFGVLLAPSKTAIAGLVVQYIGFIAAILNFFGIDHMLFIAEVVMSVGFSIVFVSTIKRLSRVKS